MADAPEPPDPKETAAYQTQMNKDTAITQHGLNSTNQVNPWGSLTYSQSGAWEDGTPRFTATTTLSPEQQRLYDLSTQTNETLGNIGAEQSSKIRELLGTNVDLSNDAVEGRLMELGRKRMDPVYAERDEQLRNQMLNSGIRQGTPAWESEMRRFDEGRNDQMNQLMLTGRGQSIQEILAARNQPLNEISALMSGSQVSMPQFGQTPSTPVSGVDYAGLVGQNYAAESAAHSGMMGGLAGLGGSMMGAWGKAGFPMPSDRRLKDEVERIGVADNGLPIYVFRYKGSPVYQLGFMADEVEKVHPEAVGEVGGYQVVDYHQAVK
jgi:hypothetical protein